LHFHNAAAGLKAILVVDNVAAGPSIGGVRMASDVSLSECFRLARAMTLKNAAAGLRHGGGKSVIFADPKMSSDRKESLIRAFANAIGDVKDYIVGPDMGTNEQCMGWVWDEIGRAVGLPREIGGIPLDEIGATGWGVAACAQVAAPGCGLQLAGARVAIQGFGSVGMHAARFLGEAGAILVAASDSRASVTNPDGIDVDALAKYKRSNGSVQNFPGARSMARDAVVASECDIWIPAARPDVIHIGNVGQLNTRLIIQGANIPITTEAEAQLAQRGVLVIPDFIANAGGVICAAVEYARGTQHDAMRTIEEKITANTTEILEHAERDGVTPRAAAMAMAERRVRNAMTLQRRY
jgi:glutamate dehydrogenase/leucine dehydrogenase